MTPMDEFWASVLSDASDASDAFSYCTADFARKCNTNIGGENIGRNGFYASLASLTSLPPLASSDCPDDYSRLEREAIQAESSFGGSESDDVPFDMPPISLEAYREKLGRLYGWKFPKISTEQEQPSCRR